MIRLKYPKPAKLIMGMISGEVDLFARVRDLVEKKYGEVDFESHLISFDYTDYYREEMGKGLKRKFISFKNLIDPGTLTGIKLFTIKVERKFLKPASSKRRINIDPGYLTFSKLILATTKNFIHRVYLGRGVYAEVTLRYQKDRGFLPWEWTYPDYRTEDYLTIFNHMRELYKKELKEEEGDYGEEDN